MDSSCSINVNRKSFSNRQEKQNLKQPNTSHQKSLQWSEVEGRSDNKSQGSLNCCRGSQMMFVLGQVLKTDCMAPTRSIRKHETFSHSLNNFSCFQSFKILLKILIQKITRGAIKVQGPLNYNLKLPTELKIFLIEIFKSKLLQKNCSLPIATKISKSVTIIYGIALFQIYSVSFFLISKYPSENITSYFEIYCLNSLLLWLTPIHLI